MKYENLPRKDKLALEWYIDCLKKVADIHCGIEICESPSLYIIYLEDSDFDRLEDKIDEVLDHNHKHLEIDKEILFSPKRFMASYEEKIEGWLDVNYCESIELNFYNSNHSYFDYKIQAMKQELENISIPNNTPEKYSPLFNKTKKQKRGVANEFGKAA